MIMPKWNIHNTSPLDISAFSTQDKDTFTSDTCPYLTTMMVQMTTYIFSGSEVY